MTVVMFTDGSAWEGNAGWSAILLGQSSVRVLASPVEVGRTALTPLGSVTNQQAEMLAVLFGLRVMMDSAPVRVRVYSDSAYVVNAFNDGWISNWRRKGWRNSSGKPVANRLYWETLEAVVRAHSVEFVHMRGHGRGNELPWMVRYNKRVDYLAHLARAEGYRVDKRYKRRSSPGLSTPRRTIICTRGSRDRG